MKPEREREGHDQNDHDGKTAMRRWFPPVMNEVDVLSSKYSPPTGTCAAKSCE
jgi:hypothetical protein